MRKRWRRKSRPDYRRSHLHNKTGGLLRAACFSFHENNFFRNLLVAPVQRRTVVSALVVFAVLRAIAGGAAQSGLLGIGIILLMTIFQHRQPGLDLVKL